MASLNVEDNMSFTAATNGSPTVSSHTRPQQIPDSKSSPIAQSSSSTFQTPNSRSSKNVQTTVSAATSTNLLSTSSLVMLTTSSNIESSVVVTGIANKQSAQPLPTSPATTASSASSIAGSPSIALTSFIQPSIMTSPTLPSTSISQPSTSIAPTTSTTTQQPTKFTLLSTPYITALTLFLLTLTILTWLIMIPNARRPWSCRSHRKEKLQNVTLRTRGPGDAYEIEPGMWRGVGRFVGENLGGRTGGPGGGMDGERRGGRQDVNEWGGRAGGDMEMASMKRHGNGLETQAGSS